jgi:cell division protein FtsB
MEEQRIILEAEMKNFKDGQAIMEKRVEEMKVNSRIMAANRESNKHHTMRTVGRWAGGILGSTVIVFTGGLGAPFVAGAAAIAESAYDKQEAKDKKKVADLQAALRR